MPLKISGNSALHTYKQDGLGQAPDGGKVWRDGEGLDLGLPILYLSHASLSKVVADIGEDSKALKLLKSLKQLNKEKASGGSSRSVGEIEADIDQVWKELSKIKTSKGRKRLEKQVKQNEIDKEITNLNFRGHIVDPKKVKALNLSKVFFKEFQKGSQFYDLNIVKDLFPNLEVLNLSSMAFVDSATRWDELVAGLPNLRVLYLRNMNLDENTTKQVLRGLKKLPNLRELYLEGGQQIDVADLAELTNLKKLSLLNCKVKNPEKLQSFTHLEHYAGPLNGPKTIPNAKSYSKRLITDGNGGYSHWTYTELPKS